MKNLRFLSINLFLWLSVALVAQTFSRASYYKNANGKMKAELKTAMYGIISPHERKSYDDLWTYFYQTDRREDNSVLDRYSNEERYFGEVGVTVSSMDKEHGLPKSWWGGKEGNTFAYSDLHHLLPSDHIANIRKNDYGMGYVTTPLASNTEIWNNGVIKVGRGTAGDNGLVSMWEPADEWKGDFARAYFYVVTCYEELEMTQGDGQYSMLSGTYPKLQDWAYKLYLKWSREDPVSDIERQRNEVVYDIQKNRNPFIDFDGLEQYIWGTHMETAFNASAYENPFDGTIPEPEPDPETETEPVPAGDYVRVTTEPEDWSGTYLIVYEYGDGGLAMNGALDKMDVASNTIAVTIDEDVIEETDEANAAAFTISKVDDSYTIKNQNGTFIGQTSDANGLQTGNTEFLNSLSLDEDGNVSVLSSGGAYLRFNSASNQMRFRYYQSSTYTKQKAIALYVKVPLLIGDVNADGTVSIADVTALVNIVLGKTIEYELEVADVNGDGTVSIADVTVLVNMILGKTNE